MRGPEGGGRFGVSSPTAKRNSTRGGPEKEYESYSLSRPVGGQGERERRGVESGEQVRNTPHIGSFPFLATDALAHQVSVTKETICVRHRPQSCRSLGVKWGDNWKNCSGALYQKLNFSLSCYETKRKGVCVICFAFLLHLVIEQGRKIGGRFQSKRVSHKTQGGRLTDREVGEKVKEVRRGPKWW